MARHSPKYLSASHWFAGTCIFFQCSFSFLSQKKNRTVDRRLGKRGPTSARWISQTKSEARAIGLLQLAVTWYKIRHAGEQAYYYSRTGTAKQCYFILSNLNFLCFGCPSAGIIISLLFSLADFVPCDR